MKVTQEFTFGFNRESNKKIRNETARELYDWRRKIKKYRTGETILSEDFYRMDENDPLYFSISDFAKSFPDEIELKIYSQIAQWEKEEDRQAVAYIPNFINHWCEEYEDVSFDYHWCHYCNANIKRENKKIYIRPKGLVKKKAGEYGVLKVDDGYDRYMVMPKLFEALIMEGIPEQYFQPAYSKNKKILAYELVNGNILPENAYIDELYRRRFQCPMCGSIHYEEKRGIYHYTKKMITKEAYEELQALNETKEYYDCQRQMMVNKKFYEIVKKYVPDAQFFPVYLQDDDFRESLSGI